MGEAMAQQCDESNTVTGYFPYYRQCFWQWISVAIFSHVLCQSLGQILPIYWQWMQFCHAQEFTAGVFTSIPVELLSPPHFVMLEDGLNFDIHKTPYIF